jgi:hypothetical protein
MVTAKAVAHPILGDKATIRPVPVSVPDAVVLDRHLHINDVGGQKVYPMIKKIFTYQRTL